MHEPYSHIAILVCVPTGEERGKEGKPGVRLYESLTCNGSLGPSEIVYLAPTGTRFADKEPTADNLRRAFGSFSRKTKAKTHCVTYLHSDFDTSSMALKDGRVPLVQISDMIESLACCQTHIILLGPGSDEAARALSGPGRVMIYSERIDGAKKKYDPMEPASIFKEDRIYHDLFLEERRRMEREGFRLVWLAEGPKMILL